MALSLGDASWASRLARMRTASPIQAIRVLIPRVTDPARRILVRLPQLAAVTPLGWTVLAGSLVAWITGTRLGWIEFSTAAAVCLLTFVGCLLFVVGRTDVAIDVHVEPARTVIGQGSSCSIRVTNTAKRPMIPVGLEVAVDGTAKSFRLPTLRPGGTHPCDSFEVSAPRRSVIRIGPATSVRGDPLGLLRRTVTWTGVTEVLVHPTVVDLPPVGVGRLHDLEGRTGDTASASDLAFHTLREYVPGDDRRHIHWRSSARAWSLGTGSQFVVRQFLETRRTHLLIVVDGRRDAYPDPADFETAISAAASVGLRALEDDLEATLVVADQIVPDISRRSALDACSRALPADLPLPDLVARGVRNAPSATAAIVVTGAVAGFADLARAAVRIPDSVRTALLRIDPAGRTGSATAATPRVLTLRHISELRSLLLEGDVW